MARESWTEVAFQVIDDNGVMRSGYYPTGAGTVTGNVAVDFVWGKTPMQPDDDRSGDGNATVVVAADAAQNVDWSGYSVKQSPALTKTAIEVTLSPGLGSPGTIVGNDHSVALNNWNGFPDYTPAAPYLDTTDQAAIPNLVGMLEAAATSALTSAGFVKGAVTTTGVGATVSNDGLVKTQTPAAATVANLGTSVALVKFLAPTVPDVTGDDEATAEAALVAVGLVKGAVTTDATGATVANDGTVKSQTPVSGGKANTGSSVALVKYLAPTVPDVLGLTEAAAESALVAAGLVKGAVTESTDGATSENDGLVKTQTPASGGKADTGSAVALVLYNFEG